MLVGMGAATVPNIALLFFSDKRSLSAPNTTVVHEPPPEVVPDAEDAPGVDDAIDVCPFFVHSSI